MNSKRNFIEKAFFSLLLSLILIYISSFPYTFIDFIKKEKISTPLDPENLQATAGILSGIVVKPSEILTAAGVLATLYVATALVGRIQLSLEDEKKRDFIEKGVSNLALTLFFYSLICMVFYFFQEDKEQLRFGEFIFYLAPALTCHFISAYPPINISNLQEQKNIKERRIIELETLNQEIRKKALTTPYLNLSQDLLGDKEIPKIKAYYQFAKNKIPPHLALITLSFPLITIIFPIGITVALIKDKSLAEIFESFPWIELLGFILFYAVQICSLYGIYDHATNKTKSEILGEKKPLPFWILILQIIISMPNIIFIIQTFNHILITDNSLFKTLIYITLTIMQISFLLSYKILWHIYKNYRKYLKEGTIGESFKVATLSQALQKAKEEKKELEQRIQDTQPPKPISQRDTCHLTSISGHRPGPRHHTGQQPRR